MEFRLEESTLVVEAALPLILGFVQVETQVYAKLDSRPVEDQAAHPLHHLLAFLVVLRPEHSPILSVHLSLV